MRRPAWILIVAGVLGVAAPAGGREPRSLRLRFPTFEVPARRSVEACLFVRLPGDAPVDLEEWRISHRGAGGVVGVRHFLVYAYVGERLAEFEPGRMVLSWGCLDLGPVDRDRRVLFASGASVRNRRRLAPGVALRLPSVPLAPGESPAGVGLVLDANWLNGSARARRVSTRVVLRRARAGTVRRLARPLLERGAEPGLFVAPGALATTPPASVSPGDVCLLAVSSHMHKRGRFLGVDLIGENGQPANPPGGTQNPLEPGRTHFFGAADYTDAGMLALFEQPRLLRAAEALRWACWTENGATRPLRLGCAEDAVPVPGSVGSPAKPCVLAGPASPDCPSADAVYPGRTFTGDCVPANLVAGSTPDDEACALTGLVFDAAPGPQCDVSALPPLE
jgi:hypothetical protein